MLVTLPPVVQSKLALVEVVELGGTLVSETVGADGDGDDDEPESTYVPNSCDQYIVPFALAAAPTPIALKDEFSMFARCPDEFSHAFTTSLGVR